MSHRLRIPAALITVAVGAALLAPAAGAAKVEGAAATTEAAPTAAPSPPPGSPCAAQRRQPWCDTSRTASQRATALVAAMTLEEKIRALGGQGRKYNGSSGIHTGGSFAIPRLGVPEIFFVDGPVGPRMGPTTAMPIPMAVAASWDSATARAHARVIGTEAKNEGNDVIYAPTVNILRTPLNGRTYESYGEETALVARMGVNWIRSVQRTGMIANLKHYAVNNQDGQVGVPPLASGNGERRVLDAQVSERALREAYLPHFEAGVKQARTASVMCAYPRVNGEWACQNRTLLQQILRKEWGFRGFVLADYGASKDTVRSLNAGLDFIPANQAADQAYEPNLVRVALASGQVTEATLDRRVGLFFETFFRFGFFDRSPHRADESRNNTADHRRTGQRIEERGITLLQNDGILPLRKPKRIVVIGPYADRFVTGGGSGSVIPRRVTTTFDGIRARAGKDAIVTYRSGSDPAAAAAAAARADLAVMVVGDVQTEGQDKSCMGLNCSSDLANSQGVLFLQGSSCAQQQCPLNGMDQDGLITRVAAAQRNTVVVLQTGGPVTTPWRKRVRAVLAAWYPGQEGGAAIARVLYGDVDPGGRLPATFPAREDQWPTAGDQRQYPGVAQEVRYSEGIFLGYKWFDANRQTPAYPFGHGLSYTTFRYSSPRITKGGPRDTIATVRVRVTNTGRRAGIAVPQLYVSKPRAGLNRMPVRSLVGWRSVRIPPGRTAEVTMHLNPRSLATWATAEDAWSVPEGCYRLRLGTSSRTLLGRPVVITRGTCEKAEVRLRGRLDHRLPVPVEPSARLLRRS